MMPPANRLGEQIRAQLQKLNCHAWIFFKSDPSADSYRIRPQDQIVIVILTLTIVRLQDRHVNTSKAQRHQTAVFAGDEELQPGSLTDNGQTSTTQL